MEFIEAMKIKRKLCKTIFPLYCNSCPLGSERNNRYVGSCFDFMELCPEEAEKVLIEWDKNHVKTNKEKLFENYPGNDTFKELLYNATSCFCPEDLGLYDCPNRTGIDDKICRKCKQDFWNSPYQEEDLK